MKKSKILKTLPIVATAMAPVVAMPLSTSCAPLAQNSASTFGAPAAQNGVNANTKLGQNVNVKYSLAGTWTHDEPHINYFQTGIWFNQIARYEDQSYKFYKPVTLKDNKLTFDTKGHDNNYHFIAQKVKLDFTIPAHTSKIFEVKINMNTTSHGHGAFLGHRVRHTQEIFDLGKDANTNPRHFDDAFHPYYEIDDHSLGTNKIWYKKNVAGYEKYHDEFEKTTLFRFDNNTDQPVIKSGYVMVSITTNGDSGKYGDIGSETYTTFTVKDCGMTNFSLVDTWTDDEPNIQHFDGGIKFKDVRKYEHQSSNSYWKPTYEVDPFGKRLIMHTKEPNNNYHFIAQRVRLDIIIPAQTSLSFSVKTHIEHWSHAYGWFNGSTCRFNTNCLMSHTLQTFNLGDNPNAFPMVFSDRQHWKPNVDKYSIGVHKAYEDNWYWDRSQVDKEWVFDDKTDLCFINNTDSQIVKSYYFMLSVTTNGTKGRASVGSATYSTFSVNIKKQTKL